MVSYLIIATLLMANLLIAVMSYKYRCACTHGSARTSFGAVHVGCLLPTDLLGCHAAAVQACLAWQHGSV